MIIASKKVQPQTVSSAVKALLRKQSSFTTGDVVERTGLTRQAVHARLRKLVESGELVAEGAGRGAHYLAKRTSVRFDRPPEGLDEGRLFEEVAASLPEIGALPQRAYRALHYAFTEIVNNAVDHSGGEHVVTEVRLDGGIVHVEISDDGIGAFENVRAGFRLDSRLDAIGEISKGKTTTDPARHSGQGLFFSSKATDHFELASADLRWIVDNRRGDEAIGAAPPFPGTRVRFEIERDTTRELRKVFDEYTTDLEFDRTRTVVRLFAHGSAFVSRSEAKRLLHGLEKFREVVLDFTGVDTVGQGFADEIFRVWSRLHAGTKILPVNMLEPVAFMVRRAAKDA